MIRRVDIGMAPHREILGNPTPLGLIGLAIACAALVPVAFGYSLSTAALKTAAIWILLFGAGCQLLSGLMNFINKNTFGGTVFTAFSFLWMINAWGVYSVANEMVPDHAIGLATEVILLIIFLVLTFGFAYFSSVLFIFLLDVDLLFAARIIKSVTHTQSMDIPIGVLTVLLGLIALWLAFGSLINPVAGRQIFAIGGPVLFAPKKKSFDWRIRYNVFEILYTHWREHAFRAMPFERLQEAVQRTVGSESIVPDLFYLQDFGYVVLELDPADPHAVRAVRLNGAGIDLYEQLVLKKYDQA